MICTRFIAVIAILGCCSQLHAQLEPNDVLLGLGEDVGTDAIELVRGPAEEFGGERRDGIWDEPGLQGVELDNLGGIWHNPAGNLLGILFGPDDGSGEIYNLATSSEGLDVDQLIGNTDGLGGDGVTITRLGGLSVSTGNDKIAVTGYDTGRVIVYDYVAGDSKGQGASLSNARESDVVLFDARDTQGTTWMNNNSVLGFSSSGEIVQVNASSMESTTVATIEGVAAGGGYTDLEYNPAVSPYLYAFWSEFAEGTTTNKLFVLDPQDGFNLLKEVDLSTSLQTGREIGLGADGNLYLTQFGGPVDFIADVANLDDLEDNNSVDWYQPFNSSSFPGMDVAVGLPIDMETVDGDFNMNGILDAEDIDLLSKEVVAGSNNPDFDLNGDDLVNGEDRTLWVEGPDFSNTYFGDANLDGEFNTSDLTAVFQIGEYEDGVPMNSGWASGDWNGDMDFDTGDMVAAFQAGGYEIGPRNAVAAAVPEPSTWALLLVGMLSIIRRRRR